MINISFVLYKMKHGFIKSEMELWKCPIWLELWLLLNWTGFSLLGDGVPPQVENLLISPNHQLIKKFPQQNPIISWLRSKLKVKLIIWSFSACQRGISYIYWKKRSISGHLLILKKNIKILMTIFFFSSGVWAKGYHF